MTTIPDRYTTFFPAGGKRKYNKAARGKTKGWSAARRRKQAENIRKARPWQNATGPRTDKGKAAMRDNALKHGLDSAAIRELRRMLRAQKLFLKQLRARQDGPNNDTLQP